MSEPLKNWRTYAACIGLYGDPFFLNRGQSARPAKAICAICIVGSECLEDAIERREIAGIRAGLSTRDRRRIIQNREDAKRAQALDATKDRHP